VTGVPSWRAEQFGVVVGGFRLVADRRVDHLGVLADQDPPGPATHPVEDDGRRVGGTQWRLIAEVGRRLRKRVAQVIG
jgi:hypothetical protein